jgi:hypothetical protein
MNSTSLLNIKHTGMKLQQARFHIFRYSSNFIKYKNHQVSPMHIITKHIASMTLIKCMQCILDPTLHACGTNHCLLNTMHTFIQQIVFININIFHTCIHHQYHHHFACKNLPPLINHIH